MKRIVRRGGRPRARTLLTATAAAGLAFAAASLAGGSATPARAAGTPPANTSPPTIGGTAQEGQTLTASVGTWTGDQPITYAYQWQRCATNGQSCAAIVGSTSATYVLTSADVGNTLRVVVTATNASGSKDATSDPTGTIAAAPDVSPHASAPPAISGVPHEGKVLTAANGTWAGAAPISFAYGWERCDAVGANCTPIAGATASTYTVQSADAGNTLRVVVNGTNAAGTGSATSVPTPVVTGLPATLAKLPSGRLSVSAKDVELPVRLVIDRVKFTPNPLRSRSPITARIHVSDTRGYNVREALVFLVGLPYSRVSVPAESRTGADGWVTFKLYPTKRLPLIRGGSLVMFVRARNDADRLIAGSSTRRLVQLRVSSPA